MTQRTKNMTTLAMLSALAYIIMVVARIPITSVEFLKYDPKDIIITISGFIFGPLSVFTMSLVVSLVEMLTVSTNGPIGFVMNVLSTCGFACTAAFIYKRKQTLSGAITGLVCGVAMMTVLMMLWNYFVTPFYMGVPRDKVAAMLVPIFLPFNLVKGGLNAAITMLVYKPVVQALRKSNLLPSRETGVNSARMRLGVTLVWVLVLATCILFALVMSGTI